jgi:hypothetical protein
MGRAGEAAPALRPLPARQRSENIGTGQSGPQRTGLRDRHPDLFKNCRSVGDHRSPAALFSPGAAPGDGSPVNKGPPPRAAGLCLVWLVDYSL